MDLLLLVCSIFIGVIFCLFVISLLIAWIHDFIIAIKEQDVAEAITYGGAITALFAIGFIGYYLLTNL